MRHLCEGDVYLRSAFINISALKCGVYSRVAFNIFALKCGVLFKGCVFFNISVQNAASIRGRLLNFIKYVSLGKT